MSRPNLNPAGATAHEEGQDGWRGRKGASDEETQDQCVRCVERAALIHLSLCVFLLVGEETQQRGGLSRLADVTHPASVIETDANPAPLQSPAAGWAGTGRGGTLLHGDDGLADPLTPGWSDCLETGRPASASTSWST